MKPRTPSESRSIATDMVLPGETNPLGQMFGGELLARMDRAAGITASRHSRSHVTTVSVNNVFFSKPIPLGSIVTIEASVSRAFTSSMEIFMDVWVEDRQSGSKSKVNEAIYTFVAIDKNGNPIQVPSIKPETELEIERYNAALRRKQLALVVAGKLDPHKATELKALFT